MKKYVIFAGVKGAGKTTLYQTNEEYLDLPRVNVDEIVREIGTWTNKKDVLKAGKIAVEKVKEYLEDGISFNQETTLCGKSIINNILKAKELGYIIDLNYVCVDSSAIAIERVRQRVKDGGHGIPDEDIIRRYDESILNLKSIIDVCDVVRVYDNTRSFRKVASFCFGKCIDASEDIPKWLKEFLK
jgi:predicted ABC-type ATPase